VIHPELDKFCNGGGRLRHDRRCWAMRLDRIFLPFSAFPQCHLSSRLGNSKQDITNQSHSWIINTEAGKYAKALYSLRPQTSLRVVNLPFMEGWPRTLGSHLARHDSEMTSCLRGTLCRGVVSCWLNGPPSTACAPFASMKSCHHGGGYQCSRA
jgi:hypothetical protein